MHAVLARIRIESCTVFTGFSP